jgi:hypothetical protein
MPVVVPPAATIPTPWNKLLLKKPIFSQLVRNFAAFYGIRRYSESVLSSTCFPKTKCNNNTTYVEMTVCKGKAVPLQAWSGPDPRKLMFPDYMTTAQYSGKVVNLKHRPPLPPGNAPGTHFC